MERGEKDTLHGLQWGGLCGAWCVRRSRAVVRTRGEGLTGGDVEMVFYGLDLGTPLKTCRESGFREDLPLVVE